MNLITLVFSLVNGLMKHDEQRSVVNEAGDKMKILKLREGPVGQKASVTLEITWRCQHVSFHEVFQHEWKT